MPTNAAPLFSALPALLGGRLLQAPVAAANQPVRHLLLDSRRVGEAAGSVFFALRGPQHDGHRHLPELYAKGVRLFVIAEKFTDFNIELDFPEAAFLAVSAPLAALQRLAADHRQQFGLPVLAITGSNGKTIVKEWLTQLLSPDEFICRSPRSYNSQVGVPLSVWQLHAGHTLGVFEAGISEPGEMARLAAVIRPTLGLFTNLGTAHDAGFGSEGEKLREKLRLFQEPGLERLFYCRDHALVHEEVARLNLPATFSWSRHGHPADVRVEVLAAPDGPDGPAGPDSLNNPAATSQPGGATTALRLHHAGRTVTVTVPFADEPSLENVLHCLAVLLFREVGPAEMQRRLARLHPVAMRLEMKPGRHGCYLLDDTYNNDLAGLTLALDALSRQARPGRRTLILSDVLETGLPPAALYARVAALLPLYGVSRLVAIGAEISGELKIKNYELKIKNEATADSRQSGGSPPENESQILIFNSEFLIETFPSTEAFLAALTPTSFQNETILIKGARRFGFERIVTALQQQQHGTVLEVDLDALSHNLLHYRQQLAAGTRLMVMVKAFAYGSGSYEVASLLQFQRADYLAVAYVDEGVQLRENGISLPIMVMNPAPDSFAQLRRYRLSRKSIPWSSCTTTCKPRGKSGPMACPPPTLTPPPCCRCPRCTSNSTPGCTAWASPKPTCRPCCPCWPGTGRGCPWPACSPIWPAPTTPPWMISPASSWPPSAAWPPPPKPPWAARCSSTR